MLVAEYRRIIRPREIIAVAVRPVQEGSQPTRRELFLLAAALTGTVLTGGAAIAGLTRTPAPQPAPPVAPQVNAQVPQVEPGD